MLNTISEQNFRPEVINTISEKNYSTYAKLFF